MSAQVNLVDLPENRNVSVCRNRLLFLQVRVLQGELSVRLLSTGKQRLSNQGL